MANKKDKQGLSFCVLCALILMFFHLSADAQESTILNKDTLFEVAEANLRNAVSSAQRYEASRQLYLNYKYEDLKIAIDYLQRTLREARSLNDPIRIIYSHSELGAAYSEYGDFENSFNQYSKALTLSDSLNIDSERTHTNYHLGKSYLDILLPQIAEPLLVKAAEEYKTLRPKWGAIHTLTNLYVMTGDTVKVNNNIAALDSLLKKDDDTLSYGHFYDLVLLSELFLETGQLRKAEHLVNEYQDTFQKTGIRFFRGGILLVASQLDFKKSYYDRAIRKALQALSLFEQQKNYNYILKTNLLLSNYYQAKGDPDNAYKYLEDYLKQYDALINRRYVAISGTLRNQTDATNNAERQLSETEDLLNQRQILIIALSILLVGVLFLLVVVDRSTKDKRKAASRLDNINKEKDHFIGVVSHDLRSPLNSIMVLSSIMKEDASSLTTDEIEEYSNIIQNSSKRMEHMVNNMLDANKIETGNAGLRLKEMNIKECLESVYHSTLILGNEKEIKTELHIEEGLPNIIGEPNAVSRIVENLMSNAYKFSPAGSTVTIKVSDEGPQIQLAVSDKGPGLTDLDRSKLFHKFEKLSASPTANEKTTGLGLYIVKNLMKEMDGTILVESEHGNGTTFKVLFNKA